MKTVFVLGGTGFVGRHVARRLADHGWDVTVVSTGATLIPREVTDMRHVRFDRRQDSLTDLLDGADVLVDVIPYEIEDGHQLVRLGERVGSIVAISTTSVYVGDQGRTMDEATSEEDFPSMPVPILETQPPVQGATATYSSKKAAIEDVLLGQDEIPVAVIRPCPIYGPGDTLCREWYFVKRALDDRPFVLRADEGGMIFHTTSVHNLAEMVRVAAETSPHGAFNCGDPDPPDVRRIAWSIAGVVDHEWDEVVLPPDLSKEWQVRNPWAAFHPWMVSMEKAERDLGYRPVATYAAAVGECVDFEATRNRDWREVLPKAAQYLGEMFDYELEDRNLAALGR